MPITITNETKNSDLTITNDSKPSGKTWAEATETWEEEPSPWNAPGTYVTKESKNTLSITNEDKN